MAKGHYEVRDNRSGGAAVGYRDRGRFVVVGSECSHRGNAQIKADRLNGLDGQAGEWARFYGVAA